MDTANTTKKLELFEHLSQTEGEKVQQLITYRKYNKAATILAHGEQSDGVYFIAEGKVRATTYSSKGKEICFQHLSGGEMFGELSALDKLPRTTSIIAETDSVIGLMEASELLKLMRENAGVMTYVVARLTGLVRFLCSRVYEYGALGTRERTRAELLRLAKGHTNEDGIATIEDMPTHEDIANRIASHREAVTKEFSALTKEGLIRKEGKKLIVPNVEALSLTIGESVH